MKKERIYLEHPIYRYMFINCKVVVDEFVKTMGKCTSTVYTEDEKKSTSLGTSWTRKEFDVLLTQNCSMLSLSPNNEKLFKELLKKHLSERIIVLKGEYRVAIDNMEREINAL